jgi:predicted small secreted protein
MKTKLKIVVSVVALISVLFLSGCNTVHGAGEDISAGGQSIERAAS